MCISSFGSTNIQVEGDRTGNRADPRPACVGWVGGRYVGARFFVFWFRLQHVLYFGFFFRDGAGVFNGC